MTSPIRTYPTFQDLATHKVLGSRVLEAKMHFATMGLPADYDRLRTIIGARGLLRGAEPGSQAYSDEPTGYLLLRTASLTSYRVNVGTALDGKQHVQPYGFTRQDLRSGDVLVAKDGPIGQVGGLFWRPSSPRLMFSSGLVRLRFPDHPLFYLGVLKFGTFTTDVEQLTPSGSTYAHAGIPLLLDAHVPRAHARPEATARVEALTWLYLLTERAQERRRREAFDLVDRQIGTVGLDLGRGETTTAAALLASRRLDAKFHVAQASRLGEKLLAASSESLATLRAKGSLELGRGQNLQVAAIGFSEKSDEQTPGAFRLLEPNFIDANMAVQKYRYLTAYRPLTTIPDGAVICSAEGSIGNIAIFADDPDVETVSNIHALVMTWADPATREENNAWIACCLIYLREKGWLDAVSVGGQGGSLAVKYHHLVPIPDAPPEALKAAHALLLGGSACNAGAELGTAGTGDLQLLQHDVSAMSHGQLQLLRERLAAELRRTLQTEFPELY